VRSRRTLRWFVGLIVFAAVAKLLWPQWLAVLHNYQEWAVLHARLRGRLVRLNVPSRVLDRTEKLFVYLPPGYSRSSRPLPVVFLLHGSPGDPRDWFIKGDAHITAEQEILAGRVKPLILVAPDGAGPGGHRDTSMFLNRGDGRCRMEDYMVRELVPWLQQTYNATPRADCRALVGLSGGGYAAVNLALKHPDTFRIAASHSGLFAPEDDPVYFYLWLGPRWDLWNANRPLTRIRTSPAASRLHIYQDVGSSDELTPENREFAALLQARGVDHVLRVPPGSHRWSYWSRQFRQSLRFVSSRLPQAPGGQGDLAGASAPGGELSGRGRAHPADRPVRHGGI